MATKPSLDVRYGPTLKAALCRLPGGQSRARTEQPVHSSDTHGGHPACRAARRWEMRGKRGRKNGWGLKARAAHTAFPRVCLALKAYLFERGGERIPSRLLVEHGAQGRARSHDLSGNQELDAQPAEPPRCPFPGLNPSANQW